ncbi:uncharacterized protein OCT59_010189 [Rhizophagus irregularis]|uniref:uncharacterized protein n=1 Tax=Rhizophagus irregularis TaxID=588596 RepID=UPI000CB792EF|nr:hypothetical protein OCT59_010189 [Rhizophagus irregularis]GBC38696.1 choice-of-anchor G family protein [Rhizophagus irregularis DAOM 181602=DAOM 197198]CAB4460710.1 unnamed protein product [Rhizophagus irregularis]
MPVTFSKPIQDIQGDLSARVLTEKEDELETLILLFESKIDNNKMPTANEIVKHQDSKKKIKRPPNSNIIYTNQLGKCGLLDIIRNFCDHHGINKQKLVPISKKVSKTLWERLSPVHQGFFEELALKVSKEHKLKHPNYKYQPERKKKKTPTYKHYDPEKKLKHNTDSNHHVENPSADNEVNEQQYEESNTSTDNEVNEQQYEESNTSTDNEVNEQQYEESNTSTDNEVNEQQYEESNTSTDNEVNEQQYEESNTSTDNEVNEQQYEESNTSTSSANSSPTFSDLYYSYELDPPTFVDYDLSEYFGEGLLNNLSTNYDPNAF